MKKYAILAMSFVMAATMLAGCRRNNITDTTAATSHATTHTTTAATTRPTTRPTETTRHTEPTRHTDMTEMPSILPEGTDGEGSMDRSRRMLPHN